MKVLVFLLCLVQMNAFAQSIPGLEERVANSIDGLLSDTVNEGETYAAVKRVRGKPVMNCSVVASKKIANTDLARCDITFSVRITSYRPYPRCETSCFIIYTVENKDLMTLSAVEDLENSCIENLGSTDCQ